MLQKLLTERQEVQLLGTGRLVDSSELLVCGAKKDY
jgi:hypothetical protein